MGFLLRWLEEPRDRRGVYFADDRGGWELWEYARIAQASRAAAHGLRGAGAARGDVVCIVMGSGPSFLGAFFGSWVLGATSCPVAPPGAFADSNAYVEHLTGILKASGARVRGDGRGPDANDVFSATFR